MSYLDTPEDRRTAGTPAPQGPQAGIKALSAPYDAPMGNVPHPLHTYLVDLQKSVREVQLKLSGKLDRPGNNFAAGNVWAGPTAKAWGQQLSARRASYNSELNKLDDELSAKLATTPATCTPDEAQDWKRRLADA